MPKDPAIQAYHESIKQRSSKLNDLVNNQEEQKATADIKQLIFLGRIEDICKIGDYEFRMRTLTATEQDEVWFGVGMVDNLTKLSLMKRPVLAKAIVSINNVPLESLYFPDSISQPLTDDHAKKLSVLGSMQSTVIDHLFDFYNTLLNRTKDALNKPDLAKK